MELQKQQRIIENKLGIPVMGLSLCDTISICISKGAENLIQDLKKKISSKRFAWIKMRALAESGQWELLRKHAHNSGIGYKPFAEICIKLGNMAEAVSEYIRRIEDHGERAILYGRAGAWNEALASVEKMKDPQETLIKLKATCNNIQALQSIQDFWNRMSENSSKRSGFMS